MRVMEVMVFRYTSYLVTIKGSVDYAECGKCGVWKMQSGMLTNLYFLDAQFVLYTNAPVYTNVLTCDQAPLMSLRTTRRPTYVW